MRDIAFATAFMNVCIHSSVRPSVVLNLVPHFGVVEEWLLPHFFNEENEWMNRLYLPECIASCRLWMPCWAFKWMTSFSLVYRRMTSQPLAHRSEKSSLNAAQQKNNENGFFLLLPFTKLGKLFYRKSSSGNGYGKGHCSQLRWVEFFTS